MGLRMALGQDAIQMEKLSKEYGRIIGLLDFQIIKYIDFNMFFN